MLLQLYPSPAHNYKTLGPKVSSTAQEVMTGSESMPLPASAGSSRDWQAMRAPTQGETGWNNGMGQTEKPSSVSLVPSSEGSSQPLPACLGPQGI